MWRILRFCVLRLYFRNTLSGRVLLECTIHDGSHTPDMFTWVKIELLYATQTHAKQHAERVGIEARVSERTELQLKKTPYIYPRETQSEKRTRVCT